MTATPFLCRPASSGAGAPAGEGERPVDLSVVVPVYNERSRLGATLEAIRGHLTEQPGWWELIVVDDGSTDGSARLVEALADPRVLLVRSPRNRGKGHAVRAGVRASRGRLVLFSDADLATPIEELARLRGRLDQGFSAAIGSRAYPGARGRVREHPVRRVLGRLGNLVIRAVLVPGIADTQCGFKLFDGDRARQVFAVARIDGWAFDAEILHLFLRRGWSVAEVPVRWTHREGSKLRPFDYLEVLADVFRVRLGDRERARVGTRR
ncbi:dolichyl-phosphate beta-glucosyltransferase [Thermomonospora umbrina]|uniref:dolichyl-phosphate beta-glucosyltransferase n=1 Tax=Thermomonospora umbrina TaxID=111806 RepID=A0A3D9SXC7_9ACTN|nr:dolichyl-phosphate beta-glucosyltransferase [Thermomonospora umbrina]REE98703.1 glycosyltransferase involved in cell wall biosynthesis [Thermomonospora umbrina]